MTMYDFRYEAARRQAPRSLDLFSGAGGLSLGFAMAGGAPVAAVDFDVDSINTFRKNFPRSILTNACPIEDWQPPSGLSGIDVIIGGPPCQGFSLARGTRFVDDPRNSLYKHFVRIVSLVKPSLVVMENVEGIINIADGLILSQVIEDFQNAGYSLEVKVINMADFGIPQTRRRAFFIGLASSASPRWPSPTHARRVVVPSIDQTALFTPGDNLSPWMPVNHALSDLCLPLGNFFSHRANSQMRGPRNRFADKQPAFTLRVRGDEFGVCEKPADAAFVPESRISEPLRLNPPQNVFQELMQCRPSWADNDSRTTRKRIIKKRVVGSRFLTIREQARLQTFPDWFSFEGSRTSQARQIGNAVPPLFAAQLFRSLLS
jgi:DNA (cytosine-5)-methyltransferase 1